MLNKFIDKKMSDLGYVKEDVTPRYVEYRKYEKHGDFSHVVCIITKQDGTMLMQSYDAECIKHNGDYINEVCGAEIPVCFLMWLKAVMMKHKMKKEG